jgi:thiol-disulfide isomerase/thioredoxin
MTAQRKNFLLGCAAGGVLTLTLLGGAVILAGVWIMRSLPSGRSVQSALRPPEFPATTAADFDWTVQSLDGRPFHLETAKGKVVFLNLWATWCGPCVREMPDIQRLYERMKGKGVVFLCVSNEGPDKVRRFVEQQ